MARRPTKNPRTKVSAAAHRRGSPSNGQNPASLLNLYGLSFINTLGRWRSSTKLTPA